MATPSRLPGLPRRLPRVLLLTTAGLLAAPGMASAAPAAPHLAPAAPPASAHPASPAGADPACAVGELCLWNAETYSGQTQHYDLRTANPEDCIPLPEGFEAHSFANRLTRDVTIYQSEECTTEGDFTTYPGGGTYVPQSPFVVRAIKIWN
ncbi:peptidase inhibitor family I36 protein [Amycolatopsis sp. FDAARGOS 1241]|uniref:peptidase inhibitor family I36 protein n=1 Tax=Amycolatopsis sp. FDAARGOS 1241 TaxID=2778070 RepID=UPI00194F12C8|nr:peptidase inhibitor family I36 protein [Amycolatopsis sp. FDAARGOS 1241]QRP48191.1 peptidase inhibitor family I36 protein [Amycolatopsis sp. FDAARGOS 1241]